MIIKNKDKFLILTNTLIFLLYFLTTFTITHFQFVSILWDKVTFLSFLFSKVS